MKFKKTLKNHMSDIIATVSILIAFITMLYTIYFSNKQIKIQIDHNKISVVPKISSNLIMNSSKNFSGIGVVNDGLGPAIIKEIIFYEGNTKIIDKYSISAQNELLKKFKLTNNILPIPISQGAILKVDTPFWFYKTKNNNSSNVKSLFDMYLSSAIYICYCSLYNECFQKVITGQNAFQVGDLECK